MKELKTLYVVCYDIIEDKVRNKVSKILESYGTRVQYSVFECYLSKTQFQKLKSRLIKVIKNDDSIICYKIVPSEQEDIERIGKLKTYFEESYIY